MDTRSLILEAGFRVLAREGVAGLSLRAAAKEAGVTPMAVYRHYADKDDLVNALVMAGLSAWSARVAAIGGAARGAHKWEPVLREKARQEGDPSGAEKLARVGRAFLDFALDEPAAFDAAFALAGRDARRFPEDFVSGKSPAGNLILGWTKQAMAEGRLRRGDPLEVWISLWALAQGLIALYRAARFSGGRRAFEAIYDRALARCLASFSMEHAA